MRCYHSIMWFPDQQVTEHASRAQRAVGHKTASPPSGGATPAGSEQVRTPLGVLNHTVQRIEPKEETS
jgi:hypothetical protein